MALRPPATAILTVTLLATANANAAWADCEQIRQQLVGQYGVVLRYQQGIAVVQPRCYAIRTAKVPDSAALDQCNAALQNLQASYQEATVTYLQQKSNYDAQCATTARYGQPGEPAAPPYATDANGSPYGPSSLNPDTPYSNQPSLSEPIAGTPPDANQGTFANPASQDYQQFFQILGAFAGSPRSGGGRGGGKGGLAHC